MKPSEYIEKGWCQGWSAKDSQGMDIDPCDEAAVSWCILGALQVGFTEKGYWEAFHSIRNEIACSISQWNDATERSKEEVLALLRKVEM